MSQHIVPFHNTQTRFNFFHRYAQVTYNTQRTGQKIVKHRSFHRQISPKLSLKCSYLCSRFRQNGRHQYPYYSLFKKMIPSSAMVQIPYLFCFIYVYRNNSKFNDKIVEINSKLWLPYPASMA